MSRFVEIIFRNKFRLAALIFVLPAILSAANFYLQRSYVATEVVWVGDPGVFGPATQATGYNNYLSPAQNANKTFSSLIATQKFKDALADKLQATGTTMTQAQRTALIASFDQLTASTVVSGAGGSGAGSGGGGGSQAQYTMTISYVCRYADLCIQVLANVVDVHRVEDADLVAQQAAAARAIYTQQLKEAEQNLANAIRAVDAYQAAHPIKPGKTTSSDPELATLQHDVDSAQGVVDQTGQRLANIDLAEQVSNGMIAAMYVVNAPAVQKGLFGIRGLRSDNLKLDAIVAAACFAAAAIYVVLVAFTDRTVRDPNELKRLTSAEVVTVPDLRLSGAGRRRR